MYLISNFSISFLRAFLRDNRLKIIYIIKDKFTLQIIYRFNDDQRIDIYFFYMINC